MEMVKKKENLLKNYLSYLPVVTIAVGLILSWARFQAQAEDTKNKVEELKADIKESDKKVEELKDKTKDTDKKVEINKTQQDNIQAQVQQISEKSDKIYDILIELKQKKK